MTIRSIAHCDDMIAAFNYSALRLAPYMVAGKTPAFNAARRPS